MRVFVLSKEGIPLMPTPPRRARLWLKARRAKVVRHEPFTIQLRFETTSYTQSVTVGVDSGSKTVGIAAIVNEETLLQAEVQLRTDISEKLNGYQTKYQRIQVLNLSKSHAHDAVAIACELGEVVTPLSVVWQMRCLPRGSYQRFNGKLKSSTRSGHRAKSKAGGSTTWSKPKANMAILEADARKAVFW
ncbi:MAG TPA: RRXRR domain-containing protein [Ktedonobacteraceae bacterium]